MGKHKNVARGEADTQNGTSSTPSPHRGEAGEAVPDLRDDVDS